MRTALITGISGQDGAYLTKLLLEKGYRVVGARPATGGDLPRIRTLGVEGDIETIGFDPGELPEVSSAIGRLQPNEIYNLRALSQVGASFEQPADAIEMNTVAVARLLEAIRRVSPHTRFYQASTSEMFGRTFESPQTEATPFHPRSPYAVAKLCGHWITKNFRESFGLFACSGILFNHESPLRGQAFVTRKITLAMARIRRGRQATLSLGNLDARRDWGFAGDYVEAMWSMLQADRPDDYVVATGIAHSVRDFATAAAEETGIRLVWEGEGLAEVGRDAESGAVLVRVDQNLFRPTDIEQVKGDFSKARCGLGWAPRQDLRSVIRMMVAADLDRVDSGMIEF